MAAFEIIETLLAIDTYKIITNQLVPPGYELNYIPCKTEKRSAGFGICYISEWLLG